MANAQTSAHLRFNQPLSWKAGKPIAVGDLLKRLQALANELKDMDQEEVPRDALKAPAAELVTRSLLEHKDKGVKAWTACCLVDVLRLCAPDAPYTLMQLKDIFTLFVDSTIPSLADPLCPYNSQHLYVLGSLSQVKSIILLTEVPSANGLILNLFKTCFDVLSAARDDLSKNVEYYMTGMLNCMIDECQGLPPEVVEIILAQFFHADFSARSIVSKQKKSGKEPPADEGQAKLQHKIPASYHLAKNICNICADRMSRYVSQYFSSVIMDSSFVGSDKPSKSKRRARANSDDSDDEGQQQGPSEDDLKQLERAHRLLRELWRSCPDVLQNVIPQVETETSAENVQLRLIATQTLGDMAAGVGIAGDSSVCMLAPAAFPAEMIPDDESTPRIRAAPQSFAHAHVAAYQQFLSRRNDKSAHIRAAWTTCVGRILSSSAGGVGFEASAETELAMYLSNMLVDTDEKVRLAAIEAVGLFSLKDFVDKLGPLGNVDEPDSILHNLADRTKDRKSPVRSEAIQLLGRLWGAAAGEIAAGNPRVKSLLAPTVSTIFNAFYVNDRETHYFIDRALFGSIVPFGYPAVKKRDKSASQEGAKPASKKDDAANIDLDRVRTERILLVLNNLDEKARTVFFALMGRSKKQGPYMDAFLKCCEAYNGGVPEKDAAETKQRLGKLIDHIAAWAMDRARAKDDLNAFAKMHDRRSYILIRFCMGAEGDYSKVYKSLRELERRMSGFPAHHAAIMETLKPLILRVANVFENRSHIRPILEFARSDDKSLGNAANDLLKHITTTNPAVFKTHAEGLFRSIESNAPTASRPNDHSMLDSLKACSSFAKRFPSDVPKDRNFLQAMMQYAQHGTPPATAKHAVSVLMHATEKKQMHAKDLLRKSIEDFEFRAPGSLIKLACVSQLMLLAAEDLEDDLDAVTDIAINQVLNQDVESDTDDQADWQDEPDQVCQSKLYALKILVNRLRSYDDPADIKDIAPPVYRTLDLLVSQRGELVKGASTPKAHKNRLHLAAATLYLKLCAKRGFDSLLSPAAFNNLALTAQAPIYHVRHGFVHKIKKVLAHDHLPVRFYCPLFLLAHEPSRRLVAETITWLRQRTNALSVVAARSKTNHDRGPVVELLFARFLSLLSHHPDFTSSPEDLTAFTHYILYYLRSVATASNISLIYAVAQKVKGVQDLLASSTSYDGDLDASENLYILSDLAQATIRAFEEEKGWTMQVESAHVSLPSSIFKAMPSATVAQETARKIFLPEEFVGEVEGIVKISLRGKATTTKKRKSDGEGAAGHASKKARINRTAAKAPKTPASGRKKRRSHESDDDEEDDASVASGSASRRRRAASDATPSSERRKSGRTASGRSGRKSYADTRESDDEEDLRVWNEEMEADYGDEEEKDDIEESSEGDAATSEQDPAKDSDMPDADDDVEQADKDADDADDLAASTSSKENTTKRSPNDNSRATARARSSRAKTPPPSKSKTKAASKGSAAALSKAKSALAARAKPNYAAASAPSGGAKTKGKGKEQNGTAKTAKKGKGGDVNAKKPTRAAAAARAKVQKGDQFDVPEDDD